VCCEDVLTAKHRVYIILKLSVTKHATLTEKGEVITFEKTPKPKF